MFNIYCSTYDRSYIRYSNVEHLYPTDDSLDHLFQHNYLLVTKKLNIARNVLLTF